MVDASNYSLDPNVIHYQWSLQDLYDAHAALDLREELRTKAREAAENK